MRYFFQVILFSILFIPNSKAQPDSSARKIIDTTYVPYSKWPYLGPEIPTYLGVNFGYEIVSNSIAFGIHHNIAHLTSYGDNSKSGGYVGYGFYYKKYLDYDNKESYEADFGVYTVFILGLNFNFNKLSQSEVIGFKPFIGFSYFNFQAFYAPNFFKRSKDPFGELAKQTFTIRVAIPICKLTSKKVRTHYIDADSTEW